VLALVETYEILGDKKYLDWAEDTLTYVLSGWDDKLGGGIYWHEPKKTSKNTCSNAPAAAACLAVAKYRRSDELKTMARKIMEWTDSNLRDPSDGLYWDSIGIAERADGTHKIEKTKWTYNTGLPLRSWSLLGGSPGVDLTVKSSMSHWFDSETGAAKDVGKFAHLLFEGLAAAKPGDEEIRKRILGALDFLYTKVRDPQGRYGGAWDKPFEAERKKFELIDQASAARAYLFAYLRLKKV
jgi:hypothetical protein